MAVAAPNGAPRGEEDAYVEEAQEKDVLEGGEGGIHVARPVMFPTSTSVNMDEMGICASPSPPVFMNGAPRQRKKRNKNGSVGGGGSGGGESLAGMIRKGVVDHQLGLSLNLILLVGLSYALFPSLRDRLEAVFLPSYKIGDRATAMYGQGPRDLWLVTSFIVFFTAVRAFLLEYVLIPVAGRMGIKKRKGKVRFAEQGFLILYYAIYWTWGVYIFAQNTPSSLLEDRSFPDSFSSLLISMWTYFPRLYLDTPMKVYYLSQLAFWAQQIIVIHLEEKRKDHYQMLTHHFVTVALMSTSYGYRQWRVGNAVLICMDVVDLIFPIAKVLKYIGWQRACDAAFALFVIFWLLARHVAYLTICWSIYAHVDQVVMPYGTYSLTQTSPGLPNTGLRLSPDGGETALEHIYQPFLKPGADTVSFNSNVRWGFLGMLLGLQCITLMWFFMICRVVVKVLRGEGADDTRSDDEDEGEKNDDAAEEEKTFNSPSAPFTLAPDEKPRFIEVEVDSSESTPYVRRSASGSKGSSRPKSKAGGGFSSGLNLGEHKEILNRIGCLSEEQLAREREKKGDR